MGLTRPGDLANISNRVMLLFAATAMSTRVRPSPGRIPAPLLCRLCTTLRVVLVWVCWGIVGRAHGQPGGLYEADGVFPPAPAVLEREARLLTFREVTGTPTGHLGFAATEDGPQPGTNQALADLSRRLAELEDTTRQLNAQREADRKKAGEKMSVNIRGHFMLDGGVFGQNAEDKQRFDEQNGLDVRVARIIVEGSGLDVMSYKVEFDYVRRILGDLWIGVGELPFLRNVRVGYLKEPFSMEQIASRKYNTFLERSLAEAIHIPPRRLGIMAFDASQDERRTWAIGLFADDPGITFVQDDDFGGAVTMRATWLPWYHEATQGRGLLHTGIAYSHRECFRSTARFRTRPESFLASYAIDTGDIPADVVNLLGTELAFVYGPFSAQSEYIVGLIDPIAAPDASIQGAYMMVSYFLTGESRNYLKSRGISGQVKPFENFFRVRTEDRGVQTGKGAWELKYRYSYLDAWDGGKLPAGRIGNHGVGINWYLNPFTRVLAEYICSTINRPGKEANGHLHIFQMRTQIEF